MSFLHSLDPEQTYSAENVNCGDPGRAGRRGGRRKKIGADDQHVVSSSIQRPPEGVKVPRGRIERERRMGVPEIGQVRRVLEIKEAMLKYESRGKTAHGGSWGTLTTVSILRFALGCRTRSPMRLRSTPSNRYARTQSMNNDRHRDQKNDSKPSHDPEERTAPEQT